jgi:hypothetical protein
MKKLTSFVALSFFLVTLASAQSGLLGHAKSALGGGVSSEDIVNGLKQALSQGTKKSTDKLSAPDGFFKDAAVKILFPPEAQKVERTLRSAGLGNKVDETILNINRAAEDAAKSAAPIFLDAVKNMSVQDGLGILRGTDTAATAYLRKSTVAQLISAFRPVIENSLQKAGATQAWRSVFDIYNKNPFAKKVNTDLPGYVTLKALDGIFFYVAEEEKNIRSNPAAQATDLLKKVFGGK